MSKVSITQAAKLVGVTRSTMHKHIDKKGITVDRDEEGKNPKIDVSELIRVYGDTLKSPEEVAQEDSKKRDRLYRIIHLPIQPFRQRY